MLLLLPGLRVWDKGARGSITIESKGRRYALYVCLPVCAESLLESTRNEFDIDFRGRTRPGRLAGEPA
jgi:hypothetical protein